MMSPRIFITGVSGYVGGQLLQNITTQHPEYQITSLVRSSSQGEKITAKHPSVQLVIGDLDSTELLIEESKKADAVLQVANSDHEASVSAIIQGLSQGGRNGVLIQLSGAASILDISAGYGQPSSRIWDDVADFETITTFDSTHIHYSTDQLVLRESRKYGVRTALLVPPMIYGRSEGSKPWSFGLPFLVQAFEKRGRAFTVGAGRNIVSLIHVKDMADVVIFFTEQALHPREEIHVEWGPKGVYYVEAGELVYADTVAELAKKMFEKGSLKTLEIDSLTAEEANEFHPYGSMMWGSNMRVKASRLRALGWKPKQLGVIDTLYELLE